MCWWQLDKNNFFKVNSIKLLLLITLCCLSFFGFSSFLHQTNEVKKQEQVSHYTPSKPRIEINGLQYNLSSMGETSFHLKADRFRIRKKKFGFIRFGLAQEALFENAEISFFCENNFSTLDNISSELPEGYSLFSFSNTFSSLGKTFTSSSTKRLSSLVMAPISVVFYDKNSPVSEIYAKNASFKMKNQEMIFLGDVRMIAGEKHIKTNKLIFSPEEEKIYLPNKFLLEIQGIVKTREPITSDISLTNISF